MPSFTTSPWTFRALGAAGHEARPPKSICPRQDSNLQCALRAGFTDRCPSQRDIADFLPRQDSNLSLLGQNQA